MVEDDKQLAAALRRGLDAEGYAVDVALSGTDGEWFASENTYDAMVVDVMLPGLDGDVLCARRRESGDWTPILMLTARSGPEQEARALDAGADDFLAKPFCYPELRARIAAVLRRSHGRPALGRMRVGQLELDPATREVLLRGDTIHLPAKEFALLRTLAADPTRVFRKEELLRAVWGYRSMGVTRTLDTHACRLRRRLRVHGDRFVVTVWGVGYRLVDGPVAP